MKKPPGIKRDPTRKPEPAQFIEVPMPEDAAKRFVKGTGRVFQYGNCVIMVGQLLNNMGWHMSVSNPRYFPTWKEVERARYRLLPADVCMAALLPPAEMYKPPKDFLIQLIEVPIYPTQGQ